MVQWLAECAGRGDAIAQHGFQHRASAAAPRRSNPAAEFLGLDGDETRRAVEAGRRVLRLAGVRPRGFVAPGVRLHRRAARDARGVVRLVGEPVAHLRAGALDAGAGADPRYLERREAPGVAVAGAAGALAAGDLLRLDLHPADLDHPRHIGAVEGVLQRAHRRVRHAVTYDDLAL